MTFDKVIMFMKGGSEEAVRPTQYTFSLRATCRGQRALNVEH